MDFKATIEQLKEKQSQPVKPQIDPEKLAAIRERFAKMCAKIKESQEKSNTET